MLRWLGIALGGLFVVALAATSAVYFVPAVQDALFRRLVSSNILATHDELLADDALRAVVCGSSSPMPDANRAKACIAIFAGGRMYVVDTGPQSAGKAMLLRLPLAAIGGVFYTHFHSDHIADLGEFNMNSWVLGRTAPLDVYGPPGVERVVAGFSEAYALDQTYRTAHHGAEIANPALWPMVAHPVPMPGKATPAHDRTAVVLDNGSLKITAIEVNHEPISPAYGYRFDYKGRSLVISGDTAKHAPLAVAANGADVLFHEAQAQHMVKVMQEGMRARGNARFVKVLGDIQSYHSSPVDAADIANRAGVKLLVLYHYTPPVPNLITERIFTRGLSAARQGKWLMSRDGTMIELPLGAETVRTSTLQ